MTEDTPNSPAPDQPIAGGSAAAPRSPGDARLWVLIPCAGSGTRAGSAQPKQYRPLAGHAMVLHTLAAFLAVPRVSRTLVLLAAGDAQFAALDAPQGAWGVVACGAATRAGTVANGLSALQASGAHEDDWVLVHDAARCLVTPELVNRLIDACSADAVGGLLALPVSDTVKRAAGDRVAATVDRSLHWLAQTPQMFRLGLLQRALRQAGGGVTDESSAIEALGLAPRLVPGDAANFKVTYAQDFVMAQAILVMRGRASAKDLNHEYP